MTDGQSKGSSWVIIVVVAILAVVVFAAGFYVGQINDKNNTVVSGLTGADKNYLSQLEFVGGFCERQGLVSSFRTAYNTDLNRYEGFPVCIQPGQ
jgi:hypothetical protein